MDESESYDVLSRVGRMWWIVLASGVVAGVVAFAVSRTYLAKTYEAVGTVYVQQASPIGGLLRDLPVSLGGRADDPSGYLITVLQSDTMLRRVATALHLTSDPAFAGSSPLSQELAELKLRRSVVVKQDKNGAVVVAARSGNAKLSAGIVNHMLDNLDQLYVTDSDNRARILAKKVAETNKRLALAEDAMLAFQEAHNVALIDEETKVAIKQLSELDAEMLTQSLELERVKSDLANSGDLDELAKLRVRQRALVASRNIVRKQLDAARQRLSDAPVVALQYARLQRNIATLSRTSDLLVEQHELAAVSQHGKDGDYRVVDWAQERHEPVGPRSAVNAAIGAAFGAILSLLIIVMRRPAGRRAASAAS